MTASRILATLDGRAGDEPLGQLVGIPRIDGAITPTVQHEHRGAHLRELVAHRRQQPLELADGVGGSQPVRVELLDRGRIPEVDVAAGLVPAHEPRYDGEQVVEQTADPEWGREA